MVLYPFVLSLSKHRPARHEKSISDTATPQALEWCHIHSC